VYLEDSEDLSTLCSELSLGGFMLDFGRFLYLFIRLRDTNLGSESS
ncbi:14626_t:CDS:1, partial [Funneliformis geosporum]